jgi:HPt (histidine-containing phosphotransfer) domain-containing protein
VERALARMGGNVHAYLRTLGKVVETESNAIERIRHCLKLADREAAVRTAHTLKGVAGNIGARALHEVASELELSLNESEAQPAEELMASAERLLAEAVDVIRGALGEGGAEAAVGVDPALVQPILEMLQEQIESFDSAAAETCEELIEQISDPGLNALAGRLGKLLGAYDFEAARTLLEMLIQHMDRDKDAT